MADRMRTDPDMDLPALRDMMDELQAQSAEPTAVTYEEAEIVGRPALWCDPLDSATDRVILYLHGGAFVANSKDTHRKVAAHLAKATGCRALVIDYRLAPENPFPAQLDDAVAAYRRLLRDGVEPGHIAVAGDSGGGGLATTTVLKLRDDGDTLPAGIVAISPWYDMEAKGETFDTNAAHDAFTTRRTTLALAAMFLGENGSATDPLANPLYADATGLPPIYLTCGGYEALRADAERFARLAADAGVDVTLEVSEGMQHIYPLMAGRAPEADRTIANIARWLRPQLGLDAAPVLSAATGPSAQSGLGTERGSSS
ncbi:alpha/beta hydrolase [Actinoallomurus sp. NPDC052308]|uniref:alpha/beta hydrolase n=1 Tax=Actinoallomurus sp. NPDC052308 TaxID=3155530 RepID=UPI0034294A7F